MTPERFRDCLRIISYSVLDADGRMIRRCVTGAREVPADVADWIESLVRYLEAQPPPHRLHLIRHLQAYPPPEWRGRPRET